MSDNLRFSVIFDAVTAQFNGAITQTSTNFNAAAQRIQMGASSIGSSTLNASQQASRAGDATGRSMQTAARATDTAAQSSAALERQTRKTNAELDRAQRVTDSLGGSWGRLSSIMATFGIGVSAKEIIELADAFKNLQAVIGLASGQGEAFNTAFSGVREIANSTFTSLSQTADLFRKVTEATRVLGTTQNEVLNITRTVNQAVQLSGASAGGAAGAILQFNQALSSGRLAGQEFNSVSEQAPRLLKIFTDELGISIGQLRKLAFTQKLTTDILLQSLSNQADKVNAEFENLPLTIGRSLTTLKNELTVFIGEADAANKTTEQIASALIALSKNLDSVVAVLGFAVQAAIAFKLVGLATAMFAKATAATAAANALRAEAAAIISGTAASAANTTTTVVNTAAINANTVSTVENAAASTQAAAAKTGLAGANTAAAASASVVNRTLAGTTQNLRAAGQEAVALGSRLVGALSIAGLVYLAIGLLEQLGTAIGEGTARLIGSFTGLNDEVKANEDAVKRSDQALKDLEQQQLRAAAAAKLHEERQAGLSEEASKTVTRFDDLVKKGKSVAESLTEITKEMRLDNLDGINNAITALNGLALQGKASGDQIRKALQDSLDGVDLATFQANANAAFRVLGDKALVDLDKLNDEIAKKQTLLNAQLELSRSAATSEARILALKAADDITNQISDTRGKISLLRGQVEEESNKMAFVHDAILGEAIKRTALSYDVLKNQVSAASASAINDVILIAQNLSELREQGLNTGLALGGALSRAISEADSDKALAVVRSNVVALRGELETKVYDGLLNELDFQALKLADSLDDAKAGINSTREAFREFGLKTREEYEAIATRQKSAFETMRASGDATADQLRQAFKKYAESAIAANGGVADGYIRSQAAVLGLEVKTDETGKTIVEAMKKAKDATDRLSGASGGAARGYQSLGNAAQQAGQQAVQSIEQQIAATRKLAQEQAKTRDEQLSKERGAQVNSADNLGGVSIKAYSVDNIATRLKEIGYSEGSIATEAKRIFQAYIDGENAKGILSRSFSNASFVDGELQRLAQYTNTSGGGSFGKLSGYQPEKTTNVNITAGDKTVSATVPTAQEGDFLSMLEQAQRLT